MITLIFFLHLFIDQVEGGLLEIQSRDQLKLIKSQSSSLAVLFNAEGASEKLLLELQEAEEELEEYQIRIVTFSCKKVKVEDCPSDTVLRITSENLYEDFETTYLHGVDSIVGQILTSLLNDKVTLIQQWSSWDQLASKWKGVSDIVLLYVDPKELKVYRYIMEVAYVFHRKFHFAVTIRRDFEGVKGLPQNEDYGLWYYHCKEVLQRAQDCKYDRMDASIGSIVDILVFLIGHSYQRISYMDDDGGTLFDKKAAVSVPLKIVYLLTEERTEEAVYSIAEQLSLALPQLVHFVIMRKDKVPRTVLHRLGFLASEFLPTAVIELRHTDYSGDHYVEQWPPDLEFTLENAKEVVGAIVGDGERAFRKTASLYDVTIVDATTSWKIKTPAIVALGNNDKTCESFKVSFRRVVRSLYRTSADDNSFMFIDYSKDNNTDVKLPSLRFYSSPEQSVEYEGNFESTDMLEFMTDHLGVKNAVLLPLSGSDKIPIDASLSTASAEEDENVVEVSQEEKEEEAQDQDEGDDFLLQQEDDQVSKYMVNSRKRHGQFVEAKEPNVPALTENNFKRTIVNTDLVLVHFYLPWDPRSFSFSKVYAQAADSIAAERQSLAVTTKMAKVNCFDWNTLCHLHNVTSYPVVLVFRHGQCIRHMRGIFSVDALIRAVRLLQAPIVTLVQTVSQSIQFAEGGYPALKGAAVNVSVLALLESENSQEFKSFLSVAKAMYGTRVFGYTIAAVTNQSCAQFRVKCPSVVVFNRADGQRSPLKTDYFSPSKLEAFIEESSLPPFGELTFENFPQYMAFRRPFVILFKESGQDSGHEPAFTAMAGSALLSQVFLTWMDATLPVTQSIMQAFVGKAELPTVVFVDHQQALVHRYDAASDMLSVQDWVKRCLVGSVSPGEELKDGKWKPLQKGYQFVHLNAFAKEAVAETGKREKTNGSAASLTFNGRLKALKKSLTSDSKRNEHDEL